MPQLELAGLTSQIFWLFINFAIIYFTISCYVIPKIHNIIIARNNLIDSDIEQAKELNSKSELLIKEYEREISLIKFTALNIIIETEKKVKLNRELKLAHLNKQIEDEYIIVKNQIDLSQKKLDRKNEVAKIIQAINNNLLNAYFSMDLINEHLNRRVQ